MNERLKKLQEIGQSVWVDSLSRDDIQNGNLERMADNGVLGVTSNPTILQQAIVKSELYDEELQELAEKTDDAKEVFRRIAVHDIRDASDIFMPVYDQTDHKDGYVSLEVAPELAFDTEGTITRAKLLWEMVDRPNLLVKIPATRECLPAIEESIADGISINVTLIFSLERYRAVAEAYIRGLERLVEGGGDPSTVSSVASFFVSRVDTETDRRLEEVGREDLKGRLAIDNAKIVYQEFKKIFGDPRWESLESRGAKKQRPLWASTSTKNPQYKDTVYVDNLIGPETVNTMPFATLKATMDHAEVRPTLEEGIDEARKLFEELKEAGVDYDDVVELLEAEGVRKFADSYNELMEEIEQKSNRLARQA
ncbi:MAG TPA: transaldolase [Rubrobacter sp.]|nr:transaldolase [Rubrobacter sp.]